MALNLESRYFRRSLKKRCLYQQHQPTPSKRLQWRSEHNNRLPPPVLREYHCPLCLSVKFAPMIIFATVAVEPQTDSGPVSETCRVEFGFSFHVKVLTEAFEDSVVYCSLVGILLVLTKGSRVMYSLTH